jgi:hypothetical protein
MTSGDVAGAIKGVQQQAGSSPMSLMDRVRGAGEWVQKNPYPAMMGLQAATGIANANSQQDAQDYQRSLIERARANLNSPVRMSFTPGG